MSEINSLFIFIVSGTGYLDIAKGRKGKGQKAEAIIKVKQEDVGRVQQGCNLMVLPGTVGSEHGIEAAQQLTHTRNDSVTTRGKSVCCFLPQQTREESLDQELALQIVQACGTLRYTLASPAVS